MTATLALSIQPTDISPPTVTIVSAPAEALPGSTPTVTARVTDKVPGMVFSGVTTQNVSFQLDGQAWTATQTTAVRQALGDGSAPGPHGANATCASCVRATPEPSCPTGAGSGAFQVRPHAPRRVFADVLLPWLLPAVIAVR